MRPWERGWDSVPLSAKRCKFQPICSGRSRLSAWLALNEAVCLPECILHIPNHAISLFSLYSLSPLHHARVIISLPRHQWSLSAGLRLTPLCHRSSDLNALQVSKTDRHFKDLCSYKVPTHSCVLGPEKNIKRATFHRDALIRTFGADHWSPRAISADPDIADHRSQRQIHKFLYIVVLCNFHIFN